MTSLAQARVAPSWDAITINSNAPSTVCEFVEAGWKFNYFLHALGRKNLFVFFPSALVRGKRHVPSFHRWSWAENIERADVLCVSDPTLRLNNEFLGAWFQGNKDDWVLLRSLAHILTLQQKFGYEKVVFCGSSLGGFVALQAGALAPSVGFNPEACVVFSENPQTCLPKYMWTTHMDRLAQVCYGTKSIAEIDKKYLIRLDVVELMRSLNHIPNGLVVIKESDVHHYEEHVEYLRNSVLLDSSKNLRVEVIPARVDSTGHTPLTLEEMSARVETLL